MVQGGPLPVRWNPVAAVNGYQVWLLRQRDQRLLWGSRVENGSSTLLPDSVTLTPGESYLVVVEADNGSSSQLDAGAASQAFRRTTLLEDQTLARQRAALPLQGRDPEATALLQADLLRRRHQPPRTTTRPTPGQCACAARVGPALQQGWT
jgi:hypothetical protein